MATKEEIDLIQKITRAEIIVKKLKINHKDTCPLMSDPEGHEPCNCGASKTNAEVDRALEELSLTD